MTDDDNHDPTNGDLSDDDRAALAARLEHLSSGAAPGPDWPDLVRRAGHRHRRSGRVRVAVAALVATVCATGGFALGHRDAVVEVASGDTGRVETPPAPTSSLTQSGSRVIPRLFARTTAQGLELRVSASLSSDSLTSPDVEQSLLLPDGCRAPIGWLALGAFMPADFASTTFSITATTSPIGQLITTLSDIGTPVMLVAVIGAGDGTARATFPDGTTDSVKTEHGIAVLAAQVTDAESRRQRDVKVEVTHAGTTTQVPLQHSEDSSYLKTEAGKDRSGWLTNPTPTSCDERLPPAGEQPTDPAAAREAVAASFRTILANDTPDEQRLALVDDTSGLEDALAQIRKIIGDSPTSAPAGIDWQLKELVFTSSTTAWVKYDLTLHTAAGASYSRSDLYGAARLVDGMWKVARWTVCADLTLVNVTCKPFR